MLLSYIIVAKDRQMINLVINHLKVNIKMGSEE